METIRKDILKKASPFLDQVFAALESLKCEVIDFELDHICYRTESLEEYELLKKMFMFSDVLLADNIHNGREISVFELNEPITYKEREISVFELPAPKSCKSYGSGYEHVEFVVPQDLRLFVQDRTHLNFNIKNIDLGENPSVKLKLTCGGVKFHRNSLLEVI